MQTPDPISLGYARVFQYDIVAVGFPGDIVDRNGSSHAHTVHPTFPMMRTATVDIDRSFVHWDYTREKVNLLLKENPMVEIENPNSPPYWLLRSTDNATSVRALLKKYEIETRRQYVHRSRQGLNLMRKQQK